MMTEPKVSITDKSFPEAWEMITKISDGLKLSGVCMKCPNQKICHSCAAVALAETGNTEGIPAYLCEVVEELRREAEKRLGSPKN